MSTLLDEKTITREEVKKAINKCFGNGEDFYLLKTGEESYILLTPFLTQENDLIEPADSVTRCEERCLISFLSMKELKQPALKRNLSAARQKS